MYDENLHDAVRRCAKGTQDGDVSTFIRDGHDQSRNDVECGDGNDEGQDYKHHTLFHLHRAEEVGMLFSPVADVIGALRTKLAGKFARDSRSIVQIFQLESQPGNLVAHTIELGSIIHVNQGK